MQRFQSVTGFADDVQVIYLLLPILVPVGTVSRLG
jgi:hypothetical protein